MKNILYAIILSIIIHLLFFVSVEIKSDIKKVEKLNNEKNKQHITFVKLKKKDVPKKEVKKPEPKKTKEIKKFKQVKKETFKKIRKRKTIKKPERTIPKPIAKVSVQPTYVNPLTKKPKSNKSLKEAAKKIKKNTLESFLSQENLFGNEVDSITQSYIDLYGEEFNNFTKVQKVFLKKHLKDIGLITQSYMVYPEVSVRTRQKGTNIVEFTLYPNGDISKIKLISSTGYDALDKSSLKTIQIAYMDYPRPEKPTKIKIYMTYVIY